MLQSCCLQQPSWQEKDAVHDATAKNIDRVWTLEELAILHELEISIAVIVYSLFDDSHRHVFHLLSRIFSSVV